MTIAEVPTPTPQSVYGKIPVASVDVPPDHKRSPGNLKELQESMASEGLLQPILVRQLGERFELVAGSRRLASARALGWEDIPAHVRDADEVTRLILRTTENVQRQQLHPIDEAKEYERLVGKGLNAHAIAKRVGRSPLHVTQRLSLLTLPPNYQALIAKGTDDELTIGEATELVRVAGNPNLLKAAYEAIMEGTPAATAVQAQLTRSEVRSKRDQVVASIPQDKLFTAQVGKDGYLYSDEPGPGVIYWAAGRTMPESAKIFVDEDGVQHFVSTNPIEHLQDQDQDTAASARDLLASLQPGTPEAPTPSLTRDELEEARRKEEAKHWRNLRKRDEQREQHITKLARKSVKAGDVSDLIFQGFLDSLTQAQRESVYTRANVAKVQREEGEGFGEKWDLASYFAGRGSLLKLAYAAMLQVAEDNVDGAVKQKVQLMGGASGEQALRYMEHLQSTGYAVSELEAELVGMEAEEGAEEEGAESADEE